MSREPSETSSTSWVDRAAWFYATGCGVGCSPVAPGTVGSLLGPVMIFAWQQGGCGWLTGIAVSLVAILIGVAAAGREARRSGREDPGHVICDELAAFTIVLGGIDVASRWSSALLGFLLFRLFDIWKPWPIRRLERLPGGWGIMADDLLAGAFARLVLLSTDSLFQ